MPKGFIVFQFLDSRLVKPHAMHQPLGPRYLQTSMQGLLSLFFIRREIASGLHAVQRVSNAAFELSQPVEFLEQSLLEILEV